MPPLFCVSLLYIRCYYFFFFCSSRKSPVFFFFFRDTSKDNSDSCMSFLGSAGSYSCHLTSFLQVTLLHLFVPFISPLTPGLLLELIGVFALHTRRVFLFSHLSLLSFPFLRSLFYSFECSLFLFPSHSFRFSLPFYSSMFLHLFVPLPSAPSSLFAHQVFLSLLPRSTKAHTIKSLSLY